MMARQNRFSYRVYLVQGGRAGARIHVRRELNNAELRRLTNDLERISTVSGIRGALKIELDVPLTRSLAQTLNEVTQRLELLTTVVVPSLTGADQLVLSDDMTTLDEGRWLKFETAENE